MSDRIRQVMAYVIAMAMVTAVAAAPTVAQKVDPEAERVYEVTANADSVDGFSAIGATANKALRARKLVATNRYGQLPSNIIRPRWRELKGVPAGFKDGVVGWFEIPNRPTILDDMEVSWAEVTDKPTIPGGSVAWPDVTDKPATLVDGVVAWNEIHNPPAVLDDRMVGWGEVQDKPDGFADGVDNRGVTGVTLTRVSGPIETFAASDYHATATYCPAGSQVTGGGFLADSSAFTVSSSKPTTALDGWNVAGYNTSGSSIVVQAHAVCMVVEP